MCSIASLSLSSVSSSRKTGMIISDFNAKFSIIQPSIIGLIEFEPMMYITIGDNLNVSPGVDTWPNGTPKSQLVRDLEITMAMNR